MSETKDVLPKIRDALIPYCSWVARVNGGSMLMKRPGGKTQMFHSYFMYDEGGSTKDMKIVDLIGQLLDGRFIAIEVKLSGQKVTDAQAAFLHKVRACGGVSGICYDTTDLDEILDTAGVLSNDGYVSDIGGSCEVSCF